MTTRPRRTGILLLGCGVASRMHSRTLRRIGGVELFYASRDAGRAEAYRRQFGGSGAYGSYAQGLADPRVHVAVIATPPVTHRALAIGALEAGKHVIVEKPAFMRALDVESVRETAAAAGRQVFVAENYAYKPITTYLRRAIVSGDLGDVRFVSINATKHQPADDWRGDPALSGGGALFEAGVHWISFASSIGLTVHVVQAYRVGNVKGPDRSSLVVFRFANGAVGTLAHSWELAAPFRGLRLSKVQGTAGAVTFESNGLAAVTTGRRRSMVVPAFNDPLGYRAMLTDFLRALETGEPPQYTLKAAQRDLALLEQAELSMTGATPAPAQWAGADVQALAS